MPVAYIPHARVRFMGRANRYEPDGPCPTLWVEASIERPEEGGGVWYQCLHHECFYSGWG